MKVKEETFFVTKYALTDGIQKVKGELPLAGNGSMLAVKQSGTTIPMYYHGEGKDWHRTRDQAVKRAEEMRLKKIKSLEKNIEKMKRLKFQ